MQQKIKIQRHSWTLGGPDFLQNSVPPLEKKKRKNVDDIGFFFSSARPNSWNSLAANPDTDFDARIYFSSEGLRALFGMGGEGDRSGTLVSIWTKRWSILGRAYSSILGARIMLLCAQYCRILQGQRLVKDTFLPLPFFFLLVCAHAIWYVHRSGKCSIVQLF